MHIDEERIRDYLREIVRGSVELLLNETLDAEADRLCQARRYERSPERADSRAGHYRRRLDTNSGVVTLKVPRLRRDTFDAAIVERFRRREQWIEEVLLHAHLTGMTMSWVEPITRALMGTAVRVQLASKLARKICRQIKAASERRLECRCVYAYLDGVILQRSLDFEMRSLPVLVAIGVDGDGSRSILGVIAGDKEDGKAWHMLLRDLKTRGMEISRLITSNSCSALLEAAPKYFPNAFAAWRMSPDRSRGASPLL